MRHSANGLRTFCLVGLLGTLVFPRPAYTDGSALKAASVMVGAKENLDRAMMGEFTGPVATAPNKYRPFALQIRPVGGDRFEAIQYEGGLPGERTHRRQPVTLIGKRSGDFLVLSGGPWAIFVEKDHCLIVDRTGKRVGRLERVKRRSPTMGAIPPKDAIVLFDGSGTDQFTTANMVEGGLLAEGADVRQMFQDFNLHLEFKLPNMPSSRDQGRANSGVYLQSRYEVQILDSFATEPVSNGCGALYRFRKPDLNMCLPPLQWQTYDVVFTAPRWASDGTKMRNARITVWHNGVKVHNNVELANKTGAGKPEEPVLLPIRLQNHRNPIRFRNIWIVDRGLAPPVRFPVYAKPARAKAAKPAPAKVAKPAPAKAEKPARAKVDKPARAKAEKPTRAKADKPARAKAAKPAPAKADRPARAAPKQEPEKKKAAPSRRGRREARPARDKQNPPPDAKPAEGKVKPTPEASKQAP
jgi:hypothetical protein